MSLRQAASGILETHVTWEEFEANLTRALNTTARFGVNKSATDIGEGNGFASRCALVDCNWRGEGTEQLPRRVVLKMGSCLPLQKMMGDAPAEAWAMMEKGIRDMHNVECYTYDLFEQFGGDHSLPRRFYARKLHEENPLAAQLCMEYIEDSQILKSCEAATFEQMQQIVRALGKLQADSTNVDVDGQSLKTTDVFADFTMTMSKEQFMLSFAGLKQLEPSLIEQIEKVEAFIGDYHGSSLPSTIHKQLGIRPVLVNGDMRTENVLVDKHTGDLRMLIDWQLSHLGVGVEDLLRISFFAQATEDRRATAPELIEEMYSTFVDNLNYAPAPFTFEQLKQVYSLLFPHCALFFATGFGLILRPNKPQAGDNDEKKHARYEVCLDKIRGVLEDIVMYHEMNKNSNLEWKYV